MAKEICILLGRRVRRLRKARGYKQIDLAEEARLSRGQISEIERGLPDPQLTTLDRLARALNVDLGVLTGNLREEVQR